MFLGVLCACRHFFPWNNTLYPVLSITVWVLSKYLYKWIIKQKPRFICGSLHNRANNFPSILPELFFFLLIFVQWNSISYTGGPAALAADPNKVFTEEDWTDPEKLDAYGKSKTLAEKAAWDYVKELPGKHSYMYGTTQRINNIKYLIMENKTINRIVGIKFFKYWTIFLWI